jgi:hypothetical protein
MLHLECAYNLGLPPCFGDVALSVVNLCKYPMRRNQSGMSLRDLLQEFLSLRIVFCALIAEG